MCVIFDLFHIYFISDAKEKTQTAREASWRRAFDPCALLLFILYHYLEQTLHFGLVPEPPQVLSARSFLVAGFDTLNIQEAFRVERRHKRETHEKKRAKTKEREK